MCMRRMRVRTAACAAVVPGARFRRRASLFFGWSVFSHACVEVKAATWRVLIVNMSVEKAGLWWRAVPMMSMAGAHRR